LKFGDVIIAVASIVVLTYLFEYPLGFVFNLQTNGGQWADGLISILLSALIVGIVFAGKIWEETRIKAILRILVLVAVLFIFGLWISVSSSDWISAIREANPHPTYTASNWYYFDSSVAVGTVFLNVVFVLVSSFIGLYIGSMLRKPKKS
jgi:flagellar biosynthesis protein FliQ